MLRKSHQPLLCRSDHDKPRSFQNSCTFKPRLSYFQKMTLTVLESYSATQKRSVLNYHNYKFFNKTLFRDQVLNKLRSANGQISDKDLRHFKETCPSLLNTIAPLKSRSIRANQALIVNKEIQRALMIRSKLRKKFIKSRPVSDKKA